MTEGAGKGSDAPLGAAPLEPDGREGWGILGRIPDPERWPGAVTPGIASIGRTGGGAGRGAGAEGAGNAGCGVCGAPAFGGSGSEAGASSGGGSWANARLVPRRTTQSDRTVTARDIGQLSR